MPPPERANLRQTAVLWAKTGQNSHGDPVLAAPVELKVRWSTGVSAPTGPQGGSEMYDARALVAVEVPVGSIMWLGKLEDWNPAVPQTLMVVAHFSGIPDVKVRTVLRAVLLRRYKDFLP